MTHYLLVTTRTVTGRPEAYFAAWRDLSARMHALQHRAWMFRAADDATRYIEFLEWKDRDSANDPRNDADVRARLVALAEFGPAHAELWIEP